MTLKGKFNKTIGILGGSGPWASGYAYDDLIRLSQMDYGSVEDDEYPRLVHISEAMDGFGALGIERDDTIEAQMRGIFDIFKFSRVDVAIIACNSLHRYYQQMVEYSGMPIVHLPDAGAELLQSRGVRRAGVFCSASARKDQLHKTALDKVGIEAILPDDADQKIVDSMIRSIMAGHENMQTYSDFRALTRKFAQRGAQSVVGGCTELSWLSRKQQADLPVVDCLAPALSKALKLAERAPA